MVVVDPPPRLVGIGVVPMVVSVVPPPVPPLPPVFGGPVGVGTAVL